jgi:hypothetical protein
MVSVAADAPSGPITITIEGTTPGGAACTSNATITVEKLVDLAFVGAEEDEEETKGGFVCTFDDAGTALPALTLTSAATQGTVDFTVSGHKGGFQLYQDAAGTLVYPLFNDTFDVSQLPKVFYIKGFVVSGSARDITFTAQYTGNAGSCEDTVKLTLLEPQLQSLRYPSYHGPMINNNSDYTPDGDPFPDPEWEKDRIPEAVPISHTMDLNVDVEATIQVSPADVIDVDFTLVATGQPGFNFNDEQNLDGGTNTVLLTSTDKIAKVIQELDGTSDWRLLVSGRACLEQDAGPSVVYVTMGTPRDTAVWEHTVTENRIRRAVAYASIAGNVNPHQIVGEMIWSLGQYSLVSPVPNPWNVPDETAYACESIVRFAEAVAKMVDLPGTFDHRNIYAKPDAPATAIEAPSNHGGLGEDVVLHPNGVWRAFLVDDGGGINNFEAAAKFTACQVTLYYPGGAPGAILIDKDQVLWVFDSLGWVESTGLGEGIVHEVIWSYPDLPLVEFPNCP